MTAYQKRNALLRTIGFESYRAYREAPIYVGIRKRVLARDNRRCRICYKKASEVHHRQYDLDTLLGKTLKHLFSICRTCHEFIEFRVIDGERQKVPLELTDDRVKELGGWSHFNAPPMRRLYPIQAECILEKAAEHIESGGELASIASLLNTLPVDWWDRVSEAAMYSAQQRLGDLIYDLACYPKKQESPPPKTHKPKKNKFLRKRNKRNQKKNPWKKQQKALEEKQRRRSQNAKNSKKRHG